MGCPDREQPIFLLHFLAVACMVDWFMFCCLLAALSSDDMLSNQSFF